MTVNVNAAVEIVRELAKSDPSHEGNTGDIHCNFCHAWLQYEPHESDCLWVRAREFVAELDGDYPTLAV